MDGTLKVSKKVFGTMLSEGVSGKQVQTGIYYRKSISSGDGLYKDLAF